MPFNPTSRLSENQAEGEFHWLGVFLACLSLKVHFMQERIAAGMMFKGKKGQKLAKDMGKRSSFVPGAPVNAAGENVPQVKDTPKPTPQRQEIDAIKVGSTSIFPPSFLSFSHSLDIVWWSLQRAIANATTLEEVERLNQMLQAGQIPGTETLNGQGTILSLPTGRSLY